MKKIALCIFSLFVCLNNAFAEKLPRCEYPRPQFVRSAWINLNGTWTYTFDFSNTGLEKKYQHSKGFDDTIIVPFCPESSLSSVEHKDFINAIWYHKTINVPNNWQGKNILIHFGAVDFQCQLFIDGKSVGLHWGGTSSFNFDITDYLTPGKNHNLVLYVQDDTRCGTQPRGKQSRKFYSYGCCYTRTTGIWQTVWLEPVSPFGLEQCRIIPDLDQKRFIITPTFHGSKAGSTFQVTLKEDGKTIATESVTAANSIPCILPVKNPKTWSPDNPFLYDLVLEVMDKNGKVLDKVASYAGMRKIHIEGKKVYLNNKPIYQRLVLDQGFYPDGIWTAPTDEALKNDILLSKKAGFNGARLHQKIFEERFHYWADKLGYLTWAESSNWGGDINRIETARNFISEWEEIVIRDRNHPSIIAWTPTNETWERSSAKDDGRQHNRFLIDIYDLTRNLDPTRPINDASGNWHQKTDLWTVHTYEQNPQELERLLTLKNGMPFQLGYNDKSEGKAKENLEPQYSGQPYIVDEYGGIKWFPGELDDSKESWGYGNNPKSIEEFYERLQKLTQTILKKKHICGYCYTQLTDIEQEKNGIYFYDRTEKFDMEKINKIFSESPY